MPSTPRWRRSISGFCGERPATWAGARTACQAAADSGHPEWAPRAAAAVLGDILRQDQDFAGARAAYEHALSSGVLSRPAFPLYFLALVRQRLGDLDGAVAAVRQAADTGDPAMAGLTDGLLGDLLRHQGDLDGARAAYRRAVGSGNPEAARHAAGLLAELPADTPPRSA